MDLLLPATNGGLQSLWMDMLVRVARRATLATPMGMAVGMNPGQGATGWDLTAMTTGVAVTVRMTVTVHGSMCEPPYSLNCDGPLAYSFCCGLSMGGRKDHQPHRSV